MHFEGRHRFRAPRHLVWETIQSPQALSRCIPGCDEFIRVADGHFHARITLGAGPLKGSYHGEIKVLDVVEPEHYRLAVRALPGPGGMHGEGVFRFSEESDGSTVVAYAGDAHGGESKSSTARRLIYEVAKQLIKQFFSRMEKQVAARLEAGPKTATG